MQLVKIKSFSSPLRIFILGFIVATVLFVIQSILGQNLSTVFSSSLPGLIYWTLFAAFLISLLISAIAGGIAWGRTVKRPKAPLVFSLSVWLTVASFFFGIVSLGIEDKLGETLWIVCLIIGSLGLVAALAGLFAVAKRPSLE